MPDSNDLKNLDSQLKKTLLSAESFKRGSSFDFSKNIINIQKTNISLIGNVRQLVASVASIEKIVNNNSRKITSLKNISKTQSTRISGENIGAKLPGSSTSNVEDSITKIAASVSSIAAILVGRKKALDDTAAFDRRKAEQEKRGVAEGNLEKKFEGLKSAAEKVISPVKSILDRIIDFFITVFLGRVVYKLLEWFGDPKNADKVKAIGRFLGDHWPKLLALYLVFGNAFGRFALGLSKAVASGAIKLAFGIAKLLAAKKVKGAMGAARFLGGGRGKLLANVVGTGVALGGAYAATNMMKGDETKAQGLAGGGYVRPRFPAFNGGGLNFKGMFGGMGNMFGMLFAGGGGVSSGFVSGEKGVDKIPAMLSDGEFVMSAGAVQKYGVDTLEGMNAAGGGTNKPKIISGTTYAAGGGMIGENPDPNYKNPGEERRLDLIKSLERYGSAAVTGGIEKGGDVLNAIKNLSSVLSGGGGGQSSGGGSGGFLGGLGYAGRVGGEVTKKVAPTLSRAGRVVGEVKKKVDPVIKGIPGFVGSTMSGINELSKNVTGASQEAIPALLNSVLGISKTDKNISTDMQRAILQAKATAG
jgi:hypothetical protein